MGSPISPMEAIQIVQKAVKLYKKIQDQPEVISEVGRRMERLEGYLNGLKELLADKHKHSLANLGPAQTSELRSIIKDIEIDSNKVYQILKRWDDNVGPFGLQLQFKTVGQALFSMGSSPDKLEVLSSRIDQHKNDLKAYLQQLDSIGLNSILKKIMAGGLQAPTNIPNHPTSPLPHPNKTDHNIIFIDSSNVACSSVAAAYIKLVREWTTRTGGQFPIHWSHSAGLSVRSKSNCVETLESMTPPIVMKLGNSAPNSTAMAALFDNKLFNYPYKKIVKEQYLGLKSRGVTDKIFLQYGFIIVFTGRQYENLIRLKQALIAKGGESLVPKWKCRIVHLGSYLGKGGKPTDLFPPPDKNKDGSDNREGWNKVVSSIKIATKAFLKRETGWQQPPPNAVVN